MQTLFPFDNTYAALPDGFFARQAPTPVATPKLIRLNTELAAELGITVRDEDAAEIFSGNRLPDGAVPLAQVYAGHQFGGFSPQLGDGRALLLGEVVDRDGTRRDIQLKGAGPTPFSRNGDGRAWLGPVLREYLVSEAMHALGVATTRALAAVVTGENVQRETALPGAVLTRIAASHIRVGTFQYFAARRDTNALQALCDYAIARHYPDADGPEGLLTCVVARQVDLIAHWMSLGFIHGVMNTDNTSISGETIDYGPCAFMDSYHPSTVFSSIDRNGRYAYSNQPSIIAWNMAQLATALVALMPDEEDAVQRFTAIIHAMPGQIEAAWLKRFGAKIGIAAPVNEDITLISELLTLMATQGADFTNCFRALASGNARGHFADPTGYDDWAVRWRARLKGTSGAQQLMAASNPAFIPRNHRVEQMIDAAVGGDYAPFERLLAVLARPYADQPDAADLTSPPKPDEIVTATFCGT